MGHLLLALLIVLLIVALVKYVFFDYKPYARTSSQFLLLKERVLLFEAWC